MKAEPLIRTRVHPEGNRYFCSQKSSVKSDNCFSYQPALQFLPAPANRYAHKSDRLEFSIGTGVSATIPDISKEIFDANRSSFLRIL
jgi:hypothetical protein